MESSLIARQPKHQSLYCVVVSFIVFTTTIIKTTSSQASFDTSSQIITTSEESVTSSSSGETSVPPSTDEGSGSDACNRLEPCTVTDMVPDPRDCTKFYVCIKKNGGGSMWQRRPCTSNRKFDQVCLSGYIYGLSHFQNPNRYVC